MDDQQDKILSKRIREVFDNFDDPAADEGWLKLREKFPEERKRRAVIWLWPAAALLLLFIGLGLVILLNKQKSAEHIAGIKPVKQVPPAQNTYRDSLMAKNQVTAPQTGKPGQFVRPQTQPRTAPGAGRAIAGPSVIAKEHTVQTTGKTNIVAANTHTVKPVTASANNPGTIIAQVQNNSASRLPGNNGLPGVAAGKTSPLLAHVDTSGKNGIAANNVTRQATAVTQSTAPNAPATTQAKQTQKPSNIDEMFAADQGKTPEQLMPKTGKGIKFGIYAATYMSYAKNGNNQVNAGGGFTAAIPLGKNLKLVTGASVNQNSFNYNQSSFSPAAAAFPAGYYASSNAKFALASETTPANYSQSASLLGIDVPLNLQYQFDTRKYPVYILGGVSSGTFINESYSNVYSSGANVPTDSYKGFNDFYFARTLNLGFGVGYPVGKSQIIIEPFLKYPLTGMGAQQLKFGASGINLKFNFPAKK